MARTIWKFSLTFPGKAEVSMPAGAKVLLAREQGNNICVWAEVDPNANPMIRQFAVYGTGNPMPANPGRCIGTAMLFNGAAVYHFYEPH